MLGQLILSGLATGSLYALTAVAVVVVFRNTRTISLAQGDFAMIGAFLGMILLKDYQLNYFVMVGVVVVACIGLGVLVERVVMRPIADSDWLTLLFATLGVYYILHGVAGWLWGRDTKAFPVTFDPTPVHIFGAVIRNATPPPLIAPPSSLRIQEKSSGRKRTPATAPATMQIANSAVKARLR